MSPLRSIVGHGDQLAALEADIRTKNVSHAYLFAGPAHLGKKTIALRFAEQLLLTDVPEDRLEQTSHSIARLMHSDLFVLDQLWIEDQCEKWEIIAQTSNVSQVHRSKTPKARTDSISIDDVRALQERLYETGSGTYRCCIIRSVERMHDTAANALLKILEEPPPGLVFILTTQSESTLLPTIISRTRVVRFHPLSQRDMRSVVKDLPPDDATFILRLSSGAPGTAMRLASDPDQLRERRIIHEKAVRIRTTPSLSERMSLLSVLHERGPEADQFLLHLGLVLREHVDTSSPESVRAFSALVRGFDTNAHRGLLTHRFALALHGDFVR